MLGLEKRMEVELGMAKAQEKDSETTASKMGFAVVVALVLVMTVGYLVVDTKLNLDRGLAAINEKAADMDRRMAKLEGLPAQVKRTIMNGYLAEVAQKVSYIGIQLESPEQKELARKIEEMVGQLKTEVNK